MNEKLSTSALAKARDITPRDFFTALKQAGYIARHEDNWKLTDLGIRFGGEYAEHPKFGTYIIWPQNLLIDTVASAKQTITATQVGEYFHLPAKKINQLFSELGWITKDESGWLVTALGVKAGGQQRHDKVSNQQFVVWHDTVRHNLHLKQSVYEYLGQGAERHATDRSIANFRQKFAAKHRTLDGHYVRSIGELRIDNWLYLAGVVHAYQRPLPVDSAIMSDFYIPKANVYIQYWGTDAETISEDVQADIRAFYLSHELHLIEIFPNHLEQLDDLLGSELRKLGLSVY